ncbi:MAG: ComEC/Rec2-related protein [Candidatus Nomurabacteria bacterium GW2011_GWA1_46_11]|uniref:ComEC/Rec2-related protein n=1 Tax=Candidatus Nomurabacteria bacterium GW2011_GWA1_46_11 TaxID=1618732 RepID=A0A0G1NM67_9BACT|nr:MAG: ComEC/Rec2-related protein [Microgenomates group bacterium GW2011_GWB1_44_8]KKU21546.1 MAG: ComEC/Rec2-related protein [Candidatus Nomurabacteria bacterium GW2011_GWA1_46_11]
MRDFFLFVIAVVLVSLRLFLQLSPNPSYAPGTAIKLTTTLSQEPRLTERQQYLTINNFVISLPRYPEYHQGDRIEVVGTISKKVYPEKFAHEFFRETPSNLSLPSVVPLGTVSVRLLPASPNFFFLAGQLRRRAESIYQATLPEPAAGLISGIVWGGRQSLNSVLVESLRRTGTLHIVAASGMNVTMAAGFLMYFLLLFISRRWAVWVGILVILVYVLAAGLSASVVRAGIMASLLFISQFFGRQYQSFRIFVMTIAMMLFVKPLWLFDIGWQLSVAATAGLLFLHPRLTSLSRLSPSPQSRNRGNPSSPGNLCQSVLRRLWSLIAADFYISLAALLATGPIILVNFGNLSLLAPLINALVLWLIGPLMVIGFLMALGGPFATVLSWLAYLLLSLFVTLIQFFGRLDVAIFEGWRVHWFFGLLYYLGLIYLLFRPANKTN